MNSPVSTGLIDLTREPNFHLGAIEVRPATREVIANGERDLLEPRVMQVLVALSRRRDEVISRDELIMSCWAGRMVGDDAINRCIGRVRRISETFGGFALETIPRIGYRLLEIDAASPAPVESTEPRSSGARWWPRHRLFIVCVGVLLIGVAIALGVWKLRSKPPVAPFKFSIAVLPFTPYSDDGKADELGDAIATSVADYLSSEGFDVISLAKTRKFRGAAKADAAQALHADFVVDGELRREGGRITVPVRIIDGANGTTLIADTVDTEDQALLPDAVATRVLGYGWGWVPRLNTSVPDDLWVMGTALKAAKNLTILDETVYAYDFARQLVASRPKAAFAYLLQAHSAAVIIPGRFSAHRLPLVLETRTAAAYVLKLDPQAGDAYAPLALVTPTFDWTEREGLLRQGLRLRPTAPLVFMDTIELRMNAGYLRLAGRMAESAFTNHPHFDLTTYAAINTRLNLGDRQAAYKLAARAAILFPKRPEFAAKVFEATAFYGAADAAEKFLEDPSSTPLQREGEGKTYRGIAAALQHGRAADITSVAEDCLKVSGRTQAFRATCLLALVKLQRLDDAYRLADSLYPDQRGADPAERERQWLAHPPFDTVYLVIPVTAPLRADPRYRNLVERVGLLQFWKERGTAPDFCAVEKVPVCAELNS